VGDSFKWLRNEKTVVKIKPKVPVSKKPSKMLVIKVIYLDLKILSSALLLIVAGRYFNMVTGTLLAAVDLAVLFKNFNFLFERFRIY